LEQLQNKNKKKIMNFDKVEKKVTDQYKDIVNKNFVKLKQYAKLDWKLIKTNDKTIKIYNTNNVKNTVKIEAVLDCSSKYLFLLCSDVHLSSILKWDNTSTFYGVGKLNNVLIKDKNEDDGFHYLEYVVSPNKLMADYRYFQGVQWHRKAQKKNGKDLIIFKTCNNEICRPPKDINYVKSKILMGIWIQELSNDRVFLTQIIQADFWYCLPMNYDKFI